MKGLLTALSLPLAAVTSQAQNAVWLYLGHESYSLAGQALCWLCHSAAIVILVHAADALYRRARAFAESA